AEDGIRDLIVTGVQTCALPISDHSPGDAAMTPLVRTILIVMLVLAAAGGGWWYGRNHPASGAGAAAGAAGDKDDEAAATQPAERSEEHTSELQSRSDLVCRLLL